MTAHRHFIPHDDAPQHPRVPRNVSSYGAAGVLICAVSAAVVAAGIVRLIVEFWP